MQTADVSPISPHAEDPGIHPHAALLADHLNALARGAISEAMSFYADDVVFHYPGHNQLSGDYVGKAAVLELMGRVAELTAGSFRPTVHDILTGDDHVAAVVTVRAERDGVAAEWGSVDVFRVRDRKLAEHWVHEVDQDRVDRFWS